LLVNLVDAEAGRGAAAFALGADKLALLLPGAPLARALSLARLLELRLAFHSEGSARVWIGAAAVDAEASAEELFARAHLAMLEAEQLSAPTVIAYGRTHKAAARSTEAGTTRLLADLQAFDHVLDPAQPMFPSTAG